jgi:release factor glutamine methyltransferase
VTQKENWNAGELLKWTTAWFENRGVAGARRQAEELLCHVLDLKRLDLYLQFEYEPTPSERALFKGLVQRRAGGEPLQYIKGYQEFCGLKIKTDRRALIPRVETEQLVARVVELLKQVQEPKVIEVGTGSGCLALGLAACGAKVWATDISEEALSLARENAQAAQLQGQVAFAQGDLFEAFASRGPKPGCADALVSNPPYIGEDERTGLERQVREFEPALALFSGPDGGGLLRRLLPGAPAWLKPGGLLALEISARQAGLLERLAAAGPWEKYWVEKDDQQQDRFFFAVLKGPANGRG